MSENITRITLEQARKLRGLSDARKVQEMSDEEVDQIIERQGVRTFWIVIKIALMIFDLRNRNYLKIFCR